MTRRGSVVVCLLLAGMCGCAEGSTMTFEQARGVAEGAASGPSGSAGGYAAAGQDAAPEGIGEGPGARVWRLGGGVLLAGAALGPAVGPAADRGAGPAAAKGGGAAKGQAADGSRAALIGAGGADPGETEVYATSPAGMPDSMALLLMGTGLFAGAGLCVYRASRLKREEGIAAAACA